MPISDVILQEFETEMANVRRILERVSEYTCGWKPGHKLTRLHELAIHLSSIGQFAEVVINEESFEVNRTSLQPVFRSQKEVIEVFDRITTSARNAIAGTSDERLTKPWSLLKGGQVVFTLSRLAVIRNFILNHSVRHRAQMSAYLE